MTEACTWEEALARARSLTRHIIESNVTEDVRDSILEQLGQDGRLFDSNYADLLTRIAFESHKAAGGECAAEIATGMVAVETLLACCDLVDDLQDDEDLSHIGLATVGERVFALHSLAHLVLAGQSEAGHLIEIIATAELRAIGGQRTELNTKRLTPGECLRVASIKSGTLGRAAAQIGAHLAHASEELSERLGEFGQLVTTAAQLCNDIDGSWPWNPEANDRMKGSRTLPLAFFDRNSNALGLNQSDAFHKTWIVTKALMWEAGQVLDSVTLTNSGRGLRSLISDPA